MTVTVTWRQLRGELLAAISRSRASRELQGLVYGRSYQHGRAATQAAQELAHWQRRRLAYFFEPALRVADFDTCRARGWSSCADAVAICAAAARIADPRAQLRVCYETHPSLPGYGHTTLHVVEVGRTHVVDTWSEFAYAVNACTLTGEL